MDRRTKLTYPNGIATAYQYDQAYRLTAMAAKDSSGTVVDAWSYAYDSVGNRTSKTDKDGKNETYQYDAVYRLTRAAYPNGSFEAFTYDPAGNRLTRQDGAGTITYSYDVANQMLTAGTDTYTYDANGNVTAKTTGGAAVTTLSYDFQNRITQITAPTASESSQYSPDGSRVFVNNAAIGGAIGPMYDTISNPVLDMDGVGSVGIHRLYGPVIDEPLGRVASGEQPDQLPAPRRVEQRDDGLESGRRCPIPHHLHRLRRAKPDRAAGRRRPDPPLLHEPREFGWEPDAVSE
jgi:YD repeat-containing protein